VARVLSRVVGNEVVSKIKLDQNFRSLVSDSDSNDDDYSDDGPPLADLCYKCVDRKTENEEEEAKSLLICDGCDYNIAHFSCLGMIKVPDGDWFCEKCREE